MGVEKQIQKDTNVLREVQRLIQIVIGPGAGVDNLLSNDAGDNYLMNDAGDVLLINDG